MLARLTRLRPAKIKTYSQGMWAGLRRFRPRYLMKLFSGDDHAVRYTLHGFSVLVNVNDWTVGRSILMKGTYETNVTHAIAQFITPEVRFLDVGANLGWFSLFVASQAPQAQVYSFEPDRRIFDLLTVNIALNGFGERVHAHHMAVSDSDGELIITDLGFADNYGARFTHSDRALLEEWVSSDQVEWGMVQAVAIDSLLPDLDFDLVKIDIEGFEPLAVRGMTQMLERCKPVIACEFAPTNMEVFGKVDPQDFLKDFVARGYTLHIIQEDGSLLDCGTDTAKVMLYLDEITGHHIDLIFKP